MVPPVSACNQILPDALQQWHESSKWLEKNQSAINSKFVEVQTQLDTIEKEVLSIIGISHILTFNDMILFYLLLHNTNINRPSTQN